MGVSKNPAASTAATLVATNFGTTVQAAVIARAQTIARQNGELGGHYSLDDIVTATKQINGT